jgi:hypothetical protein
MCTLEKIMRDHSKTKPTTVEAIRLGMVAIQNSMTSGVTSPMRRPEKRGFFAPGPHESAAGNLRPQRGNAAIIGNRAIALAWSSLDVAGTPNFQCQK